MIVNVPDHIHSTERFILNLDVISELLSLNWIMLQYYCYTTKIYTLWLCPISLTWWWLKAILIYTYMYIIIWLVLLPLIVLNVNEKHFNKRQSLMLVRSILIIKLYIKIKTGLGNLSHLTFLVFSCRFQRIFWLFRWVLLK